CYQWLFNQRTCADGHAGREFQLAALLLAPRQASSTGPVLHAAAYDGGRDCALSCAAIGAPRRECPAEPVLSRQCWLLAGIGVFRCLCDWQTLAAYLEPGCRGTVLSALA